MLLKINTGVKAIFLFCFCTLFQTLFKLWIGNWEHFNIFTSKHNYISRQLQMATNYCWNFTYQELCRHQPYERRKIWMFEYFPYYLYFLGWMTWASVLVVQVSYCIHIILWYKNTPKLLSPNKTKWKNHINKALAIIMIHLQ